jgi:hypothetical protein
MGRRDERRVDLAQPRPSDVGAIGDWRRHLPDPEWLIEFEADAVIE